MRVRRLVYDAVFLAMAIALGIAESFIPNFVPGVKLGLANVVVLIMLYGFGVYEAAFVSILRVFVVALLRGNIFQMPFFMSLAGAIASLLVMFLARHLLKMLTIYGVSLLGSYFHCLAQCLVAVIFLENWAIMYYFPFMVLLGMATGILVAFLSERVLKSNILPSNQSLGAR